MVVATSWKWLLNEDLGVIDGFLIGIPDELLEAARLDGITLEDIPQHHSAIVSSCFRSGRNFELYLAVERLPLAAHRH